VRYQIVHNVVSVTEADDPDAAERAARDAITCQLGGVEVLDDAEITEITEGTEVAGGASASEQADTPIPTGCGGGCGA
jgi:ferredoxin